MKFCPECGEDLRGFTPQPKFCPGCGLKLEEEEAAAPAMTGFLGMGMFAAPGGFGSLTDASDDPEELLSFNLSNGGGMMCNAGSTFIARRMDGKALVTVRTSGVALKDAPTFEADAELLDRVAELFARCDVASWDGFSKSDPNVMDGSDFSFSATYGGKRSIGAHGYMMWPPRFGEVSAGIRDLLMPLYEERFPDRDKSLNRY